MWRAKLRVAFYRHPAFAPHRALRRLGIRRFAVCNGIVTAVSIVALTVCAWYDDAFVLSDGFGYLQHPGIWGWFLIQLIVPIGLHLNLKSAGRCGSRFRQMAMGSLKGRFRETNFDPMVRFVGLETLESRALFSLLFLAGFAAFSWNTFQNLQPGVLARMDFWDSINYPAGYFGTRLYKFYIDALLLPSAVHIFAGIVWTNLRAVQRLSADRRIQLLPYCEDRCGGFGFLADLILTPTLSALAISGLAFFGVVYTHNAFDVETATGLFVQTAIIVGFYVVPTMMLRATLVRLKRQTAREIFVRQATYYEAILSGKLHDTALRDAHEYLRYFDDIVTAIDRVPNWPHLAKVAGVFGLTVSPALILGLIDVVDSLRKVAPNLRQ